MAKNKFTEDLMSWFAQSHRPMPWKGEKDPYLIWLSEIILQQTRVEQGLPYFNKFKENYPTVKDLADAPEDEVMKMWEGLGYYSRARNLHFTAKTIANELEGKFPNTYKKILKLKGVGPYTAAAVASFAYDLPHAVLDGNVYRVLSRYFGITTPIDTTEGKKEFSALADKLLDVSQPAEYNQAIMDFGATVCKPAAPDCENCPLNEECVARHDLMIDVLPIKSKKTKKRTRYFHYLLLEKGNQTIIQKRTSKDIWRDLYQFPLIETETMEEELEKILSKADCSLDKYDLQKQSKPYQQLLTHQKIIAVFWKIEVKEFFSFSTSDYLIVDKENISQYAFPKVIDRYLNEREQVLELF